LIGSERKLERKVKEMYLSYKLNTGISKEKILELYLNKIFFGHNAYGIEEAAQTFFGKSSKEVGILESSILSSLPK
jgi:penicillin-binding protein 1A